jgi:hypothetical protein
MAGLEIEAEAAVAIARREVWFDGAFLVALDTQMGLDRDTPMPLWPLKGGEEPAKTERLAALVTVVGRFKFKRRDAARDSMVVMLLCNSDCE